MGCEMGRSLRGFASVVVSAIMTRALLLLGRYNSCENERNYDQLTLSFDRATAANPGSD